MYSPAISAAKTFSARARGLPLAHLRGVRFVAHKFTLRNGNFGVAQIVARKAQHATVSLVKGGVAVARAERLPALDGSIIGTHHQVRQCRHTSRTTRSIRISKRLDPRTTRDEEEA